MYIMKKLPAVDMLRTGKNIEKLRTANGMSVRDLQEIFGFSTPQAIYKWQRGMTLPTVDNLIVLASVFHTPVDDIIATDCEAEASFFYAVFPPGCPKGCLPA